MFQKIFSNPLLIIGAIALITLAVVFVFLIVVIAKGNKKSKTNNKQAITEAQPSTNNLTEVENKTSEAEQQTTKKQTTAKTTKAKTTKKVKQEKVEEVKTEETPISKKEENETKPKKQTTSKSQTKKTSTTKEKKVKEQEPVAEVTKEPKQEEQKEEAATEVKEKAQKYMITYDKEEKLWVVKKTNAKKASKKFKTKAEAYTYADRLATNQDLSLTVKKKDGKFQKAENAKKSVKKTQATEE